MKRTQQKDALRNIRKQFVSFLSILIVVMLGVGIFLACRFGAQASAEQGELFYREMNYRDIAVRSTTGITEEDVRAVQALEGVAEVEPIFAVDLVAQHAGIKSTVHASTVTERIDLPVILEGSLPQSADECAVDRDLAEVLDLSVGGDLTLRPEGPEKVSPYLQRNSFRITAVVIHPENIHLFQVGSHNVLLTRDAFQTADLGVDNTEILVRADVGGAKPFSAEYAEAMKDLRQQLAAIGRERSAARDEEIVSDAEKQLAEGEEELAQGREELDAGHAELEENTEVLNDAQLQLELAREKLASGGDQLESGREELEKSKAKLDAAKQTLDAAEAQLTTAKNTLDSSAGVLATAKEQLASGRTQLDEAEATINEKQSELAAADAKLAAARQTLDAAEQEINRGGEQINALIDEAWKDLGLDETKKPHFTEIREHTENFTLSLGETLAKMARGLGLPEDMITAVGNFLAERPLWNYYAGIFDQIPNGEREYADGLAQVNEGKAQLAAGKEEYAAKLAEYNAALTEYEEGRMRYEAGLAEYNVSLTLFNTNKATYEDGVAQYEEGLAQYEAAKKEYDDGKTEFEEKEKEYEEGREQLADGAALLNQKEEEYEAGKEKLEEGREQLANYHAGNWLLMERKQSLTWHDINETVRTFSAIAWTFALLFILLGVLVCYATIGKIIDEQRKLVGTTKALGFTEGEIMKKYLLFGCLAAFGGCVAGVALSYSVLERIMLDKIRAVYTIGEFQRYFSALPAILSVVIGVAVAAFAVWMACRKMLSQPATSLMSGATPPTFVKKQKAGEQRKSSLYSSLIGRNIRTDLNRVLVTVVSIAGCCILLLTGFTVKFSMGNLIDKQFEEVICHDLTVRYLPSRTETAREDIREILDEAGVQYAAVYNFGTVMRVGAEQEFGRIICGDPDSMMLFYHLTDMRKNTEMRIPDEGAVIFQRLAEICQLEVGDHISILDPQGTFHDVPVAGIYTCYAGRSIYLSQGYATELFGDAAKGNAFIVRTDGADAEALEKRLAGEPSLLSVDSAIVDKDGFQRMSEALNVVIVIMVVMAGIMAAVVLLNLLRMQINQKRRELTIMRVNGFTTREAIGYILRENIITTAFGVVLGLVAGNVIVGFILRAIERMDMQMIRTVSVPACVISALITVGFAALMNFLAVRKIKELKLTDANE